MWGYTLESPWYSPDFYFQTFFYLRGIVCVNSQYLARGEHRFFDEAAAGFKVTLVWLGTGFLALLPFGVRRAVQPNILRTYCGLGGNLV